MRSTAIVLAVLLLPALSGAETVDRSAHARHRIGVQLGGSGVIQGVYRLRTLGPVFLDVGVMAATHVGNGSAGLVVDVLSKPRFSVYFGGGVGGALVIGDPPTDECDPITMECMDTTGSTQLGFFYGRAGANVKFGRERRHSLALDIGLWRGVKRETEGGEIIERDSFLIPMAGFSYFFAI